MGSSHQRGPAAERRRAGRSITTGIEAEIDACHELSARKRLGEFAFFALLYALGALPILWFPGSIAILLPGIVLMGVALNSLGILIHEGLHGILAKNPRLNHFLTFLCGVPLLISGSAYRATHRDHHFEFGRRRDYGTYRQHLDNRLFVWTAYYAQLCFGSILYILMIPGFAWRTASPKERAMILVDYAIIATLVALLFRFVALESILHFWIYPSLVLMVLTNIRGLSSHALGDLDDIYLSSRTVHASPLTEILFLHENFHLEHHLFPQVPSYHLKRAHRLVWNRLPRALYARSYPAFLLGFLKATLSLDLRPLGVVHPSRRPPTA